MKRCPGCGREYDNTMAFCLDDGAELLYGPAGTVMPEGERPKAGVGGADEPVTAILHETAAPIEAETRAQIHTTEAEPRSKLARASERQSLSAHRAAEPQEQRSISNGFDKRLLLAPLILAAIVLGGFAGYRYWASADGGKIDSIAVLPFENRSGSGDTEYLSDGLADSLIYRLSQLPNLKVSPTSSVMRYKGKGGETAQIAKELNVDAVMSGRLVQIGDSLNISVQLIDARTDKLIWAEQYDRKMSDLLATQREIATAITEKLQLKLIGDDAKGITKRYTDNNEAYQLYLKGRYHFARRTKGDILKGIEHFQRAIELDPNFALALSSVAESYNVMPSHGYLSPREATLHARAAVEKALAIDPTLAEAHTQLASVLSNYDRNWAEAEAGYKRALALDPNNSTSHLRYGQHLWAVGRLDESIAELSRSIELEPLSLTSGANLTLVYLRAGQKQKALELAKRTHDLDPNFVTGRLALGAAYIGNAMYDDAIQLSEDLLQTEATNQWMLWISGCSYARSGRRPDAEKIVGRLKEIAKTQYGVSYYAASIYAALGEKDKAFAELEYSFEQRDWWVMRMKSDPLMDPLRDDPRFKDLLNRMNLPE